MQIVAEMMMAVSLAACVGLRAWMPLLMVGLLSHAGYLSLNTHFAFLARTDTLIVLGVATVLELLGDKVIVVDHFLDAIGTVVRPAAATILASSMLTHTDPVVATVFGLIVGGGTALTVHGAKSVLRAKVSALAPLHGGAGNASVSLGEDLVVAGGVLTATHAPFIAFGVTVLLLGGAIWLLMHSVGYIRRWASVLRNRRSSAPEPEEAPPISTGSP